MSDDWYRTLVDEAPDGIVIVDRDGRYLDANPSMCRMVGYAHQELVRMHTSDLVVAHGDEPLAAALETISPESPLRGEWEFRRKDGTTFSADVIVTATPDDHLLAVTRDLTAIHTLQAQLHQAQKMEAIGKLAGSVAHDFNNLLTVILGCCEMLLEGTTQTGHARHDIEQIEKAGLRAAALTQQLLALSRKQIIDT